ncbi:MAG: acyl-CoA dehydrogenase family protein [Candidatus Cloacimonetes bacterium]|nr:acyl-CoA dehydrogenase family protein [Candidatus Cloacimonadota bacterium]
MSIIKFTNEQKLIQKEIRKFATSELEPIADEIEKNAAFPTDIINNLSELGFSALIIPEKYGGVEMDTTSLCITIEELSRIYASVGSILAVNNCLIAYPIIKYANENQKEKYLNKLSSGEIGGFISEPEIDVSEEEFEAKKSDNGYLVNGKRDFVLNGEAAKFFIMPFQTSDGKAFYFLEKDDCELEKNNILGIRAAGTTSIKFNELILKNENCFITEQNGEKALNDIRDYANICFSAISLGLAQASLEAATKYSKERKQFGKYICEFPMIQEMLTEMKIKIETARLLVYDAASKYDNAQDYSVSSKIARIYCGDMAVNCGLDAIQIYGGYGYIKDYPVERYFRDAKVLQVLETTPRLLKSDIAKELLK